MEKEEWKLPASFGAEKKYIGELVYYRQIYMSEDLGRVHDSSYDGKSAPHIIEDGKYPSCCKEYLNASSMIDTICKCGKHWIYVVPQGEYQGSTEIRIFILKMDIKKKMTIDEFFEILKNTPRKWKLREDKIELITPDLTEGRTIYIQDPLTAVATMLMGCMYANNNLTGWSKAGDVIGLSHKDIMAIFLATDNLRDYNRELRQKLLKSTDLD